MLIYSFTSRSRIFLHLYGDITIAGEGLQNLSLCSALRAFQQRGIFIIPHLLWHGTLVFPVSSEGLPIQSPVLTHKGEWRIYSNPDPHESMQKMKITRTPSGHMIIPSDAWHWLDQYLCLRFEIRLKILPHVTIVYCKWLASLKNWFKNRKGRVALKHLSTMETVVNWWKWIKNANGKGSKKLENASLEMWKELITQVGLSICKTCRKIY
jgi:hypothetical protein